MRRFVKKELINMLEMWTDKHRPSYNARHGLCGFIQQGMVGKLCSTPSHYTEPH